MKDLYFKQHSKQLAIGNNLATTKQNPKQNNTKSKNSNNKKCLFKPDFDEVPGKRIQNCSL